MVGTIAALVVSIAACGGDSSSPVSTPDEGQTELATEEFGLSATELATRVEDTEALIATCMSDAGFQYVALDSATVIDAMASDQTATGISDEDYVKQYGLGITTQFDKPIVVFAAGPENATILEALPRPIRLRSGARSGATVPDWNHVHSTRGGGLSLDGWVHPLGSRADVFGR